MLVDQCFRFPVPLSMLNLKQSWLCNQCPQSPSYACAEPYYKYVKWEIALRLWDISSKLVEDFVQAVRESLSVSYNFPILWLINFLKETRLIDYSSESLLQCFNHSASLKRFLSRFSKENFKFISACLFGSLYKTSVMPQWPWTRDAKPLILAYLGIAEFSSSEFSSENLTV